MISARVPGDGWTWRRTVVVLLVVLVPAVGLSLSAEEHILRATDGLDALILWPAAVVSAFACYAAWRIQPRPGLAWATIGVAVLGFQELARAANQLVTDEPVTGPRVLEDDIALALVVVVAIVVAHHAGHRLDPAAAGFGIGAVMAGVRLAGFDASAESPGQALGVVAAGFAALLLGGAALVARGDLTPRLGSAPPGPRLRIALPIAMIGAAHLALLLGDSAATRVSAAVAEAAGAVVLLSICLAHFIDVVEAADRSHHKVHDELETAVRADHAHRARLHEINSTIAGITSASQLLRSMHGLSTQQRNLLDAMVAAELGRLQRLVAAPPSDVTSEGPHHGAGTADLQGIDLDGTVGLIVVSHEARGRRVHWTPSGLRVKAHADAVAEVLDVLLDNAARHGRGTAEVAAERHGDFVEVVVHDDGPGVDPGLRARLFEWGARGPDSNGQGIGLYVARELAEQQGGYLQARETPGGATFVLGLPEHVIESRAPVQHDRDPPTQAQAPDTTVASSSDL